MEATLTLKLLGVGQFEPPCGFSKNISSKKRVKPGFFVTFNIIISPIFKASLKFLKSFRSFEESLC